MKVEKGQVIEELALGAYPGLGAVEFIKELMAKYADEYIDEFYFSETLKKISRKYSKINVLGNAVLVVSISVINLSLTLRLFVRKNVERRKINTCVI